MATVVETPTRTTYAERIDRAAEEPLAKFEASSLGHQEAYDDLLDLWEECRTPDWDGHGAAPVSEDTVKLTLQLLKSLPLGFPPPSLGAEPDGQITLDWHKSRFRTLSVSVDAAGFLHYAGLYGHDRKYGTIVFRGKFPDELGRLVGDL